MSSNRTNGKKKKKAYRKRNKKLKQIVWSDIGFCHSVWRTKLKPASDTQQIGVKRKGHDGRERL